MTGKTSEPDVVQKITSSPKYRDVSRDSVAWLVRMLEKSHKSNVEKVAKNLLHQTWGAFYTTRPSFSKLEAKLKQSLEVEADLKTALVNILKIHSSTKERLPILNEFYREIFRVTGIPNSIIDLGCGLNPLTLPWMGLPKGTTYTAVDIDSAQMLFIEHAANILGFQESLTCQVGDASASYPKPVDVIFMFKLITVLEKLQKDFDLKAFLNNFQCKYFVITYPTGSLSGKDKGMADFYTPRMRNFLRNEDFHYIELNFATELVFIVQNTI